MRQPVDPAKIAALMKYYCQIKEAFRKGTLDGKVGVLLKERAITLGISLRTFWRAKRGHSV